jgi:uncharacterized membrane protein YbaN (DUF454 family)
VKRQALRVFRLTLGSLLLIVGVIGGFIPILQGWIFVLAGLGLLSQESDIARRWLEWAKERARQVGGQGPGGG